MYEKVPCFVMSKVNSVAILLTVLVVKLSYTTWWHCFPLLQTAKHPWTFNVPCPRPPLPNPPSLASMCSLECGGPPHPSFFPSHLENKHMKREVWNSADRVGCMCVWVCVCQGDGAAEEVGLRRLAGVLEVEGERWENIENSCDLFFISFSNHSLPCAAYRSLEVCRMRPSYDTGESPNIQKKVIKRCQEDQQVWTQAYINLPLKYELSVTRWTS